MKEFYQMLVEISQTYRFYWGITQILLVGCGFWLGFMVRDAIPYIRVYFKERKLKRKEVKG